MVNFLEVLRRLVEEIRTKPVGVTVVYPIIYEGLYIPGGWEWDFFHQQ